jgi:methionine sulfoxide reductase heme-binding subunit
VNKILASKWTKVVLFLLSLFPIAYLSWGIWKLYRGEYIGSISANPIEYITHYTGDWTIRFLLITLAITPLRFIFNRPQFTRYRRMFGLFAFFYGVLHLMTWAWFDKDFVVPEMWADIAKRPYITVGMLGFVIMIPLAITSTAGWVRRLSFKRWQKLHRIVYIAPAAGVVHYWWLVKSDIRLPLMYGVILGVLMAFRVYIWTKAKPAPKRVTVPDPTATVR